MADISKINLSGAVYNIKDATARANLNEIQNISNAEIDEITDLVLEELELDGSGDIATAIASWLDAHPEATTTIEDGSVTADKLADAVRKGYVRSFETMTIMQAATDLKTGMTCHTNGFHSVGDGGAAYYTIAATGDIACQNGLYATKINTGNEHLGVLVLGDSYGEGYTPDGNVESWISYFTTATQRYGYTVYSSALGGAGFYRDDAAKKFSTLASNLIATLTTAQKESISTVIVGGGYNDRDNTRANIYNGMVELRNIIKNNLPNVRRVLVFPFGMGVQGLTTGSHANFTYSKIVDMVNNYVDANAEASLGTIVGNSHMLLRRNVYFSSDYVHPKQNGNYILGSFVSDVFFGNSESLLAKKFNDNYTPNLVSASNMTIDNNSLTIFTSGGQFILKTIGQMSVTPSTPFDFTFDGAHPMTIGTFNDAALQQYGRIRMPVSATVRSSTSSPLRYQQVIGWVDILNGVMEFDAIETNAAGTNYLTVNSVDLIRLKGLDFVNADGLQLT